MHKTHHSPLTLVVLAAGIGSRYGGLKQIDPVGPHGELIVDYSVYDALRAGFQRVVFVISRRIEATFRERVGRTIERQCDTDYVFQQLDDLPPGFAVPPDRVKPWGTGHATLVSRTAVNGPFAVINADDFYGRDSFRALGRYLAESPEPGPIQHYAMVGFPLENTLTEHGHVSRGICQVDGDGFLVDIQERTRVQPFGDAIRYSDDGETWIDVPEGSIASMNAWGFTPDLFAELEARFAAFLSDPQRDLDRAEFYLPQTVGELVAEGCARVRVLPTPERWFGVTYPGDKARGKAAIDGLVQQGVYPARLWS